LQKLQAMISNKELSDLENQIQQLNNYVNAYYKCDVSTEGERLNYLLQKITGTLYYLETMRSKFHNLFESKVQELVSGSYSVSKAVNEANVKFPQMYQLRRVMDAGYKVAEAIRSNISFLKSEKRNG